MDIVLNPTGLAAACMAGIVLGLLGGGGSVLTVPIIVYLFHVPPSHGTTYSLFAIGLASVFGLARNWMQGHVAVRSSFLFLLPSMAGTALARRAILPMIPEELVTIGGVPIGRERLIMGFLCLVLVGAARAMLRPRRKQPSPEARTTEPKVSYLRVIALGLAAGIVMGLVGAGGGFMIVPVLVAGMGMPMRLAIGSSMLIICINSLSGFSLDWLGGKAIDWTFALSLSGVISLGTLFGTEFSRKLAPEGLSKIFGWLIVAVAVWIFSKEFVLPWIG